MAVITAVATTCNTVLAACVPAGHTTEAHAVPGSGRMVNTSSVSRNDPAAATAGQNHKLARRASPRPLELLLATTLPLYAGEAAEGARAEWDFAQL
ncbi:hypothetical protein GCM10025784_02580 [Citricoccus nitrophenolicus]